MSRRGAVWLALLAVLAGIYIAWPRAVPLPRDVSFSAPLPEDRPLRIAAIGTSLTARALWPDALAIALESCGGGMVELSRLAEAGAHSGQGRVKAETAAEGAPDLVIVEFAINDADLWDGLSLGDSRANHEAIIATLRSASPETAIVLMTTNPLRGIRRLTRPRLAAYYNSYHEMAATLGTGLFDGYARWRAQGTEGIEDGLHPLPAIEAELITQPLVRLIAEGYGLRCE